MKSYEDLHAVLERSARRASERNLTVAEVMDGMEEASYAFLCLVFALPFLWPLSLGPLSVAGGINLAALGWQLASGRPEPWLPERVRRLVLPEKVWRALIGGCLRLFTLCRRFTRPRGMAWVSGLRGRRIGGSLICAGGLLMALPFFALPFNNTLPALLIVFVCIAELEQDAAMLLVALFWLVVTLAYFGAVLWVVFALGLSATDWVRGLF
jgi:hypothetical protein